MTRMTGDQYRKAIDDINERFSKKRNALSLQQKKAIQAVQDRYYRGEREKK